MTTCIRLLLCYTDSIVRETYKTLVTTNHMKYKYMQTAHKKYLDELRDSGVVNMFGATPYIMREFGGDNKTAKNILLEWMDSYK